MKGLISALTWFEKNIKLGLDPFRRWEWPGIIGIIRAIETRRGFTLIIRGSAQSWKTLACALWGFYSRIMFNGNMGWYALSGDLAKKTAEEKVNTLWDQVAKVFWIVPKEKRTIEKKELADNYSDFFSQQTPSDRINKSLMEIEYDEAWKFEKGNITEIQKRRGGKLQDGLYRERLPSTGGELGSDLEIMGRTATRYEFRPPCDHCGKPMHYKIFPPRPISIEEAAEKGITEKGEFLEVDGKQMFRPFGGFRFLTGEEVWYLDGTMNTVKVHDSVHYCCEHCGKRNEMDATSQEERVKRAVERDIEEHGEDASLMNLPNEFFGYHKVKPGKRDVVEFYFNGLLHANAFKMAEEWNDALKARERGEWEPTERFYRERGALHYSPHFHIHERTRKSNSRGKYRMAKLDESFDIFEWWPEAKGCEDWVIVQTQDVQLNHYWVCVRAWIRSVHGVKSRLVWFGQTFSTDDNKRIQKHFGAISHESNFLYDETGRLYFGEPGCTTVVDGNYDVDNQIKQAASRNEWVVLRGRKPDGTMHKNLFYHSVDNTYRLYGELKMVDAFVGTVLQNSQPMVAEIQYCAEACLNILEDFRAIGGEDPNWSYAMDVPEAYLEHLSSWVRLPTTKKDGTEGWLWQRQNPEDHGLDTEKMQIGVISMRGWIGAPGGLMGNQSEADTDQ